MKIEINKDGTVTIDGKVFVEQQSDAVAEPTKTKLQEAKERYPVGTRVKCLFSGTIKKIAEGREFDLTHIESTWLDAENDCRCKVYHGNSNTWAEIVTEPLHLTIDDIYDSVEPVYWVDSDGFIEESSPYVNGKCQDSLPTKEDAEYILATMQLINIANYYNAKYPLEQVKWYFIL